MFGGSMMKNKMHISFLSKSENESFARATVGAFVAQVDPTLDELTEIKTVVSEAVTNAIIHGYHNVEDEWITIECEIEEEEVIIKIIDEGVGINNIAEAMEPLYTSKEHLDRSGMGFTIMETFMDGIHVESEIGKGTTVILKKQFVKTTVFQ